MYIGWSILCLSSSPMQTMAKDLTVSKVGGKCPCVSGNVLPWSIRFDVRNLLTNVVLETLEVYRSSVRTVVPVPSSQSSSSVRPSRRPFHRRPSSVRPLSVRGNDTVVVPYPFVRRPSSRRPSSVRFPSVASSVA